MTNLKKIATKINSLKEKYTETAKQAIFELLEEFFTNFPEVHAIQWEQYTPYFNDGDPCTFSVAKATYFISQKELDEGSGYSDYWTPLDLTYDEIEELGVSRDRLNVVITSFRMLQEELNSVDDDAYLSIFGDPVQVTATRDGIKVEEYDHD